MGNRIVQRPMNATEALVVVNNEIQEVVEDFDENSMAVGVYTKKLEGCFKTLKIVSKKILHFGRNTAPPIMDSEEVCDMDQSNT